MSDSSTNRVGSVSPHNIDTITYRILQPLPVPKLGQVGETFTSWPQGEVFACVSGLGLGVVKNGEIADWLDKGLIVCDTPLTPFQEREVFASLRSTKDE